MSADNIALAHRWFEEVWNKGRTAAIDEMMDQSCVVHGLGDAPMGPADFKAFHNSYVGAFPDVSLKVDEVVADRDIIAIRWSGTGRHAGNALGFDATNKQVQFRGMSFVRVHDGKIVEGWNSFDELGMMRQLGQI